MFPKLEHPKYELTVPSSGKKIFYRPFTTKEYKSIAVTRDTKGSELDAVGQLLSSCTYGDFDAKNSPTFDVEYVLTNIRAKSVSEVSRVSCSCIKCNHQQECDVDLASVKVVGLDKDNVSKIVNVSDTVGITLKYPTLKTLNVPNDISDEEKTFVLIARCIENIFDLEQVYPVNTDDEKVLAEVLDFIGDMTTQSLTEIKEWLDVMPKSVVNIKFMCAKCGHKNDIDVEGILNFL